MLVGGILFANWGSKASCTLSRRVTLYEFLNPKFKISFQLQPFDLFNFQEHKRTFPTGNKTTFRINYKI